MKPTGLGNTRFVLGLVKDAPGGRAREVRRTALVRQEPDSRPVDLPVGPQLGQESREEQRVAIFLPLALLHPAAHPVTVDVSDVQFDRLAAPEPRAIGRLEYGPVAQMRRDREEGAYFLTAQDERALLRGLGTRNAEGALGAAEGGMVEKSQPIDHRVTCAPREAVHLIQMKHKPLDVSAGQKVRTLAIVDGQTLDRLEIRLLRALDEAPDGHIFCHLWTQCGHRTLLLTRAS